MVSKIVDSYLQIRRATGCGLQAVEPLLRNFAKFADDRDQHYVVAQAAIEWAGQSQSPFQRDRRLKTVIRFARYAHAEDIRHEIPPDGVFGTQPRQRPVPFIFSVDEITRLMNVASRHHLRNTLLPHTYICLIQSKPPDTIERYLRGRAHRYWQQQAQQNGQQHYPGRDLRV